MFGLKKMDKGNTPIIKQMPAAAATYAVGEVAALSDGVITKVSGTVKPTCVVVEKGTKTTADTVSVQPIYPDQEYTTTLSAAGGSLKVGDKVTIASDSARVTATTTNGVATILNLVGTASGSLVTVKFD